MIVLASAALFFVVIVLLQAVLTPWGRSLRGGPTLTGEWSGLADGPDGRKWPAYIDIRGLIWGVDDCMRDCDVNGTLRVCTARGVIQDYTFDGDVAGRKGDRFTISLRKAEDRAYGWRLDDLKGQWSGADKIILSGEWRTDRPLVQVTIITDSNGNTVMSPPPRPEKREPAAFRLRRSDTREFVSACNR